MSYNNTATIETINIPIETKEVMLCSKCKESYDTDDKFCKKDGSELEPNKLHSRVKNSIQLFREYSEIAKSVIDNDGNSSGEGFSNVHEICDDLKGFSKNYPDGIWQVDITWDQGFGDLPSRYYVMNGKIQQCEVEMKYE